MLRACDSDVRILALYIDEEYRCFFQMLAAGAMGCIPLCAATTDLVKAIRTVSEGYVYLYPSESTALVYDYLRAGTKAGGRRRKDVLTPRQRQVLTLAAEGLSSVKIAQRLRISANTVARHRQNIMARLNLHSYTELIKYAIRKGLTEV